MSNSRFPRFPKSQIVITPTLLVVLALAATAQTRIDGRVVTTDSIPVHNAIVQLRMQEDSTKVYRATTDSEGRFSFFLTSIEHTATASGYALHPNYPNPFSSSTTITFSIPLRESVTLVVHDLLGRHVRTLVSEQVEAGTYRVVWDGRNSVGQQVSSGAYLLTLSAGTNITTKRIFSIATSSQTFTSSSPGRITGTGARLSKTSNLTQATLNVLDSSTARPRFISEKGLSLQFARDTSVTVVVSTFDFNIYVCDYMDGTKYLYSIDGYDLSVDTINVGGWQRNIAYDRKRDRIYGVSGKHPGRLFAIDRKTRNVISRDMAGLMPDLPDSRVLMQEERSYLFAEMTRSKIAIIHIDTDSVVGLIDDSTLLGGRHGITFAEIEASDSVIFLRIVKTSEILEYNFIAQRILSRFKITYRGKEIAPRQALRHPDKKRIFIVGGSEGFILVLNTEDSSLVHIGNVWFGYGHIALTHDGRHLLHSEYDGTMNPIPGDLGTYVKVYDANTYQYIDSISTRGFYREVSFGLDEIVVSENSSFFAVAPGGGGRGTGPIYICDISTMSVVSVIPFDLQFLVIPVSMLLIAK